MFIQKYTTSFAAKILGNIKYAKKKKKLQNDDKRKTTCTVIVIAVNQGIAADMQSLLSVIGSFHQAYFFWFLSLFRAFLGKKNTYVHVIHYVCFSQKICFTIISWYDWFENCWDVFTRPSQNISVTLTNVSINFIIIEFYYCYYYTNNTQCTRGLLSNPYW